MFTVLLYRLVFKIPHSLRVYTSLTILTIGVIMVVATNLKFHWMGFAFALLSTLIFVVQNIFSKKLFTEASIETITTKKRLDKLNLLLYSGTFAFIFMFPLWLYYDGAAFFTGEMELNVNLLLMFFLNGITHFLQALFAFSILALVSPITYSIASLFKRIFVITASIFYFSDSVSFLQGLGILVTFFGLYLYHLAEVDVDKTERQIFEVHNRLDESKVDHSH
jgi:drug/metabolite transporter (DMT)-like permease